MSAASAAGSADSALLRLLQRLAGIGQRLLLQLQELMGLDLGILDRQAEVVHLQHARLALQLLGRIAADFQECAADLLEPARDVAAGDLHPQVLQALAHVDPAVAHLLDHGAGIVTDAVEGADDLGIAVGHLAELISSRITALKCPDCCSTRAMATTRPGQGGQLRDQRDGRCVVVLGSGQAQAAQRGHAVEVRSAR